MKDPTIFAILLMINSKRAEYADEPVKVLIKNKSHNIIKTNFKNTPNFHLEEISVNAIANLAYIVVHCENKFLCKIARRRLSYIKLKYGERFK